MLRVKDNLQDQRDKATTRDWPLPFTGGQEFAWYVVAFHSAILLSIFLNQINRITKFAYKQIFAANCNTAKSVRTYKLPIAAFAMFCRSLPVAKRSRVACAVGHVICPGAGCAFRRGRVPAAGKGFAAWSSNYHAGAVVRTTVSETASALTRTINAETSLTQQ
jgi:hypothetical protein